MLYIPFSEATALFSGFGADWVLGIALYRATAAFPERRLQFEISLLVQLLGSIVVAAIVTYSIYVIEHAQQAEERRIEEQKLAADNKTRVLHFIKDELSYDLTSLKDRNGDIAKIQQQPLRSDFWRIAGLSGDLKWIDDIDTLNSIAQAYFNIDQIVSWEARYLDATMGMTATITMNVNNGPPIPLKQLISGRGCPSKVIDPGRPAWIVHQGLEIFARPGRRMIFPSPFSNTIKYIILFKTGG